jgi:lysophospholipase L1-like esterase
LRVLLSVLFVTILASCAPTPRQDTDIVVIGDSVMAWNRSDGRDIGSVIAAELQRPVLSRANFGAQVRAGNGASLLRLSIPDQLPEGPWNWVVMNGGANDLGFSCGCTRCAGEIEALISPDGQVGAIPDLISRAQAQGARVLWLGYYRAPETRSFEGCRPGLVEIERRIARLAATRAGVFFLDAEDVLDPPLPEHFDRDRTHPSALGSSLIGAAMADLIKRRG